MTDPLTSPEHNNTEGPREGRSPDSSRYLYLLDGPDGPFFSIDTVGAIVPDDTTLRDILRHHDHSTSLIVSLIEATGLSPDQGDTEECQRILDADPYLTPDDKAFLQTIVRWRHDIVERVHGIYDDYLHTFFDNPDKKAGFHIEALESLYDQTEFYESRSPLLAAILQAKHITQNDPQVIEAERLVRMIIRNEVTAA